MTYRIHEPPVATIFVGKTKQPFYVHLDLLCDASSFFKAAFAGNSKEASENIMQLPDDREDTFKLFVDWLYDDRQTILPAEEDDDDRHEKLFQAVYLVVLADKYRVYDLRSEIFEILLVMLIGYKDNGLLYSAVAYAYENSTQGSGIRPMLAVFVAFGVYKGDCEATDLQALVKQQPDLAFDMIATFARYFEPNQTLLSNLSRNIMLQECKNKSPGQENEHSNAN